jgi:hypothetical protein
MAWDSAQSFGPDALQSNVVRKGIAAKAGTTAENDAYTGVIGEITFDTDTGYLRAHDGSTAGGDVVTPAAAFRGALVHKAADQATADYTTGTAIAWDAEAYDTDSIHDTVTNNSRLTVPTGVTQVKLSCGLAISSLTADMYVQLQLRKGGSTDFIGQTQTFQETGFGAAGLSFHSPKLDVVAAEYFDAFLTIQTDASVTLDDDRCWFAMEIIA